MKFAKYVFLTAGIYGVLVIAPQYFLEAKTGADYPPAVTHPEFYYGFVGVALAWQVVFLILSKDPVRYRLMMIPSVLEKFTFGIAVVFLHWQHRTPPFLLGFAMVDLMFGVLFIAAYLKTAAK
jgi:hypothetical protein